MRPRRAFLYMPGDDMHKIQKATNLDVDCICMDIEDSVTPACKGDARATIVEALQSLAFNRSERLVRINSVGSGYEEDDLAAVLPAHPHGIVIPKVDYVDQVKSVSAKIEDFEGKHDLPNGSIHLIIIIETALGIVNLPQIASADSRLEALVFGAEDFASDIGATRTQNSWEVFYARSAVVTHAAAFGLQAIDQVYTNFRDVDGLRQEARTGAEMGFAGKQIIHPNQVIPTQEVFTPDDEAITEARQLIEAYHEHQSQGIGAFALDGKMIDEPIIRNAERVVAIAKAAGKLM